MIQMETVLEVADNTGAKKAKMIRRLGQVSSTAKVGDVIKVSILESSPDAVAKKGTVCDAVIVRTIYPISRDDGSYLRFGENACVIIGTDGNPKGTRIFGPVAREVRKKFMKIVSLAQGVL